RRRHTRWPRDWSSDVCSSDLESDAGRKGVLESDGRQLIPKRTRVAAALSRPSQAACGAALDGKGVWSNLGVQEEVFVRLHRPLRSEERRVGNEWRCCWSRQLK